jgi:hypothetical protein
MVLFPGGSFGRMSEEPSLLTKEQTSKPSSIKWATSGRISQNGQSWTRKTSESPNGGGASFSSLASILESLEDVPIRYFLSARGAGGILNRSEKHGKKLPEELSNALEKISSLETSPEEMASGVTEK